MITTHLDRLECSEMVPQVGIVDRLGRQRSRVDEHVALSIILKRLAHALQRRFVLLRVPLRRELATTISTAIHWRR